MKHDTDHLQHAWSSVDGIPMHARISVHPLHRYPPIVLVHGLVVSSRYMVPTARLLARDFSVYVPDLPGFGRSAHPAEVLDIAGLARALACWMDTMEIPSAILIGNSLGCQTIGDFAVNYPARVIAAVLAGPTMDDHARTPLQLALRLMADEPLERQSMLPIQVADFLEAGPIELLRTLHYALYDRLEQKLPLIQAPTLIVRGERDPIVSQRWVDELATRSPAARVEIIRGAPHALNYSAPAGLVDVVLPFIRDVVGPRVDG